MAGGRGEGGLGGGRERWEVVGGRERWGGCQGKGMGGVGMSEKKMRKGGGGGGEELRGGPNRCTNLRKQRNQNKLD